MRRRAVVALSVGAIALATSCRSDLAGPTLRGNVATTVQSAVIARVV